MIISQIIFFVAVALVIAILLRRASKGEGLGETLRSTSSKVKPVASAFRVVVDGAVKLLGSSATRVKNRAQNIRTKKEEIFQPTPIENRPTHEFWQNDFASEKNELPSRFDEGEKLVKEGKLDEAEQFFVRLASNHPNDSKIYARLGLLYLNAKNYSDAIEALKVAVKLDKYNPSRHYNLGLAYMGNNDTQRAISSVREAISLDPVTQKYRQLLEQLLNRE